MLGLRVASVISIDGIFSVDNHGCIRCRAQFSFRTPPFGAQATTGVIPMVDD
jgi:hypothetical protein